MTYGPLTIAGVTLLIGAATAAGGWLYDAQGRAICQGWDVLATYLRSRGVLMTGAGVAWRRADLLGAAALVAGARVHAADGRAAARAAR